MRARAARAAVGLIGLTLMCAAVAACRRDTTLGPPDAFQIYAPTAAKSATGLPVLELLKPDDARAAPLQKQLAVGFPSEMVRTDYLAKQLVRDPAGAGHPFPDQARAAAAEPTVMVIGGLPAAGEGLAVAGFWGKAVDHPGIPWIALQRDPESDPALPQSMAGLLGRHVARRVAGAVAPEVLVEGYGRAMEVIAREWRVGEGPQGALPPDAGTGTQRALFAGVRENQFVLGPDGAPRPAAELLADPGVAATVIYRLAQSKSVGRRVAPADVYAPFVADRVPPGVSPAAVLGPFRNFQVKLLSAWARAAQSASPPRDIAELVDAYVRALPGERAEATRIFVITTYGATVKPGGVRAAAGADAGAALPELTALAAEVAAGKRSSRQALDQTQNPDRVPNLPR
jgi:hypothetical protein